MNPQTSRKQFLITLLLLLVLALIVAGYVYFGMNYAKKMNLENDNHLEQITPATDVDAMSQQDKLRIIEELNIEATSNLSEEERSNVIKNLDSESTENTMPEAKRLEILNALGGDQGIPAQ